MNMKWLFGVGVGLVVLSQVFGLTSLWWWAIGAPSRESIAAAYVTWFAGSVVGSLLIVIGGVEP